MKKLILILFLTGCQFYSKIEAPKKEINAAYLTQDQGQYPIEDIFNRFKDPTLIALLKEGIKANLDLKIAVERICQAKAEYGVEKSKLWPQIDFQAEVDRLKFSSQGIDLLPGVGSIDSTNGSNITNLYFTSFDAAWEIDIFQKLSSEKKAAFHEILSLEQTAKGVFVSLQAEIASTYFALRSLQEQKQVLEEHLKSRKEIVKLINERFTVGLATGVEVDRSDALASNIEAELPRIESDLNDSLSKLCVLLGKKPKELALEEGRLPKDPGLFGLDILSDLLRRRPDIAAAEEEYLRSQYKTRSAKADLFPRFSLIGSFGFSSFSASNFFTNQSSLWSIGPAVRWPIFHGWGIISNINKMKSIEKQVSLNYYLTVLKALQEVENSLVLYGNQKKRDLALEASATVLGRASDSTWELYTSGLSDFNEFLDVEKDYLQAEQNQIASNENTLKALIMLYKAIGGSP
jgi:multidrug efflux system outer membrane protein